MKYRSSKTYGHEQGLSCAFRQWRAESHCRFIHGYALSVHLEFEADTLNDKNWVQDFGSLKPIKAWLVDTFDHKTLVARDDPKRRWFEVMAGEEAELMQLQWVDATGCEAFAEMIFNHVSEWLNVQNRGVRLVEVRVREHPGNSGAVVA